MGFFELLFGDKMIKRYREMSTEELSALSDDELFTAVFHRTEKAMKDCFGNGIDKGTANDNQIIFFSINVFNGEMENGGLCQFFVNSSRSFARMLSNALDEIGATAYSELYDRFLEDNGIDPDDLSVFDIHDASEYESRAAMYPFENFNSAYAALQESDPLKKHLTSRSSLRSSL